MFWPIAAKLCYFLDKFLTPSSTKLQVIILSNSTYMYPTIVRTEIMTMYILCQHILAVYIPFFFIKLSTSLTMFHNVNIRAIILGPTDTSAHVFWISWRMLSSNNFLLLYGRLAYCRIVRIYN